MPMSMVVSAAWPLVVVRAVVIVVVWMVVVVGVVVVRRGGTVDVPALIAAAVRFGGERPSQRGWRRRGQIAGDPAQIVRTRAAIVRQHRSEPIPPLVLQPRTPPSGSWGDLQETAGARPAGAVDDEQQVITDDGEVGVVRR